jgi:exosortase
MQQNKIPVTTRIASALYQHQLAAALKFSVIAIVVVLLYLQDLTMVFTGAITNDATYHILAIPFIFGYLLYRKRKMVNASLQTAETDARGFRKYFNTLAGILLCAVAILTYWYGSYTFIPLEYHMLTLPFLAAGLILLLFNTQTLKQLLFPIAFLLFLTPPPDQILYGWGSQLANLTASASNGLANLLGMHATFSTNTVGPVITLIRPNLPPLSFNVDVACSGIYSIIGFIIFAVFVAYITRGKIWHKLAILIMGIPLILALNIIRITTILAIGYNFGENLALTFFHDIGATVLMFIGVLVLLVITDKVFKRPAPKPPCPTCSPAKTKPAEPFCPSCGKLFNYPKIKLNKADLVKIVGVFLITVMLLSIQAPVFALTQGPAQVITQTASGIQINTSNPMLPTIPGYTLSFVFRDTQFEQESGDDAALVYEYSALPNATDLQSIWVAIQISSSITSEHQWETCLVDFPLSQGQPAEVTQLDLRDIQLEANPPMTGRYFAFQYIGTNQSQVVLYWYETAIFDTNQTAETKSVMISLITYPSSTQTLTESENQELPVAKDVNSYWQPVQSWSVVALAMSQNGLVLSTLAVVIFAVLILYTVFFDRRKKKLLLNLYSKLSEQNKTLLKAVDNAEKQGNPTTEGILTELQKLTNATVDKETLVQKLTEAEHAEIIEKAVANREDEPIIEWKSQLPQQSALSKLFGKILIRLKLNAIFSGNTAS